MNQDQIVISEKVKCWTQEQHLKSQADWMLTYESVVTKEYW